MSLIPAVLLLLATLAPPAAAADLEQLTKDLLLQTERYHQAAPTARSPLLQKLRDQARARAQQMKAAVSISPSAVLQVALSQVEYDRLPRELQPHLERRIEADGVIEAQAGAPAFPYRLRDRRGRTLQLAVVGQPPEFVDGSSMQAPGVELGDIVIVRGQDMRLLSRSGRAGGAPVVTLASPRSGDTVRGTVTIRVEASDDERVAQASVAKDGQQLGTREHPPYEFAWDTRRDADGPHRLSAKAHDPDFNVGTTPAATITVDNTPPRVRLTAPAANATIAGAASLAAEAADAVGLESVKFLLDGNVIGVAVRAPHTLAWDSGTTSNGRHLLEAVAVDRAQNTAASAPVEIRVVNRNAAPVLEPIGDRQIQEALTLSFTVEARDPDGDRDPLRVTASNLPPWAAFDSVTRQFLGTPGFDDASHEEPVRAHAGVRFEACDSQPLCDSEVIAIRVTNVNRPPTVTPVGPVALREGQAVSVSPAVSDPDGDTLTCKANPLPRWARLEAASCTIKGTPGSGEASQFRGSKSYPETVFEVCDPEPLCAQTAIVFTVADARQRPDLAHIGDREVDEGKSLRFSVQAGDPDGDSLTLTAEPLPDGATFVDEGRGSGLWVWIPGLDQAGAYPVTFTASDGALEDSETVTFTVRDVSRAISGVVEDVFGKPFPRATVRLSRPGDRTHEALTDAKGRYVASGLAPGTYTVKVEYRSDPSRPTGVGYHFSPLSHRVDLTAGDQRDVNFSAVEN